ncbi:MDR family MFS transporter [Oryzibacter oryziterrae]|uniref:MDR family MFS transporter n=1 Tax=Oryzibacter oryziterrae TaxID=2766474 RepID=UPI001F313EEB|nr:MDR family MFS transporter [Oryzibacter oryziterrae]
MSSLPPPPSAALTEPDRVRIVIGVLIAMFLAALDQTIVTPAMPTIGAALGGGLWLSWIVSAYFLTSTAVTPLFGKLADLKGRRPVLYASIGIFLVGSVVCALAPSMAVLIGGRAIQGIGGGGLMAVVQTIIGDVAPPRERARYMIYISTLWAVSSLAGPVLGGVLAQHVHWSMIFWINLPIGLVGYLMSSRALQKLPDVRRPHKLDVLGALMVMVATVLLLLALTWGGTVYPWNSLVIIVLIWLSLFLFGFFGWYQLQPEEPLLPPRVLANPVVAQACSAIFFSMAGFVGLSVFFPVYLELVEGLGAAASGLALVALMGGTVAGANVSGRHMRRSAHYKRIAVLGSFIASVSLALLGVLADTVPFLVIEAIVAAAGFGLGTLFPVVMVSVQNAAEPRDLGVATATLGFLRSLGSVIGIAVLGAILGTAGVSSHIGEAHGALVDAARLQTVEAFRWLFFAAALSQLVSLALLLRMEEKPLRGHAPPVPAGEG